MIDVVHVDEVGFAPTLPPCYSWYFLKERLRVPYEAPQGRRVNAIGAYFAHGPLEGRLDFQIMASLPKSQRKGVAGSLEAMATKHGLSPDQVGVLDADTLVAFLWNVAGRPEGAGDAWKRAYPLYFVLDNYSVHKSNVLKEARKKFEAANVFITYLSSYSPELSGIEPIWQDVKHHRMSQRSYPLLGDLFRAVDDDLHRKASDLLAARSVSPHSLARAA